MDLPELATFNHSLEAANYSNESIELMFCYILWYNPHSFLNQYRIVDISKYFLLGTFLAIIFIHFFQSIKKREYLHLWKGYKSEKKIKLYIYFLFSSIIFCLQGCNISLTYREVVFYN